jgi:hypothetical protein
VNMASPGKQMQAGTFKAHIERVHMCCFSLVIDVCGRAMAPAAGPRMYGDSKDVQGEDTCVFCALCEYIKYAEEKIHAQEKT